MADLPYHIVVGMPALSPTMETGALAEWYVAEGDFFIAGDSVAKIETDKASIDFEAQDDGYVAKLLQPAGDGTDISVNTPIMITVEEEGDVAAFQDYVAPEAAPTPAAAEPEVVTAPTPAAAPTPEPIVQAQREAVVAPPTPAPTSTPPPPPPVATPTSSADTVTPAWGFAAATASPLAKSLAAQQKAYLEMFGTTGQRPLL
jgi:pyruvate dehydrogenase E2 component (dihydrolipoamide acetyltransferase)